MQAESAAVYDTDNNGPVHCLHCAQLNGNDTMDQ